MDILILGAIVLGITQIVKITFDLGSRFIPLVSLIVALAIISVFAFANNSPFNWELIQNAIIAGLTAGGLWSGSKATFSPSKEEV